MSVADEIKSLKDLLDSGVLTQQEFDQAKRGLLQNLSKPSESMPTKAYFLGKWRMGNDLDASDIRLLADGKFKINIDLSKAASQAGVYLSMVKLLGGNSISGQWWLDGELLRLQGKGGNAACRHLLGKYGDTSLGEVDFENLATTPFDLTVSLVSHSQDELHGICKGINIKFFRLSTDP